MRVNQEITMQEYRDGTYGEIKEGKKLLKKLLDDVDEMEKTA